MTLKGHNALWYANRGVLWLSSKSYGVGAGIIHLWRLPKGCQ